MAKEQENDSLFKKLWYEAAKSWPSLPLLSYGFLMAWLLFAATGTIWLSDVEESGKNLTTLYVITTIANGLTFLLMSTKPLRKGQWISRTSFVLAAGFASFFGSALIIFTGPYFLSAIMPRDIIFWLFVLGGILTGVGNGIIGLRAAMLYGSQPPRVTLLYVGFSIFVTAFAYFAFLGSPKWSIAPGSPTNVGICAFLLLPLAAAIVSIVPSKVTNKALTRFKDDDTHTLLPGAFYRLVIVGLVLALATSMMRASVVHVMAPVDGQTDSNLLMLIRIAIAVILIFGALCLSVKSINFGKVSTAVVVVIVLAMACSSAASDFWGPSSTIAYAAFFLFEVIFWCILSFVVYQKNVSAVAVFGIGQGVFLLGCAVGWLVGTNLIPLLAGGVLPSTIMAFVGVGVLIVSVLLFNDRVFDSLFSPSKEGELDFQTLVSAPTDKEVEENPNIEKRLSFKKTIEQIAEEFSVSPREADVLRLLATGRGSDYIASDLQLSRNTVRTHTHNIYLKLGVHSREELISFVDSYRAS